jgi:hypothetical protein
MKHEPNVDAIRQLKRLWPRLRQKFINDDSTNDPATVHISPQQLPNLYIFGAQCSDHFRTEIHDPSIGLYMEGYYPWSISKVLWKKRVLLSPLRFGAGIKGKHIEAWHCSLPIVTTSIGSEGMMYPNHFNCPNFFTSSALTSATTRLDHPRFGGCIANSDTAFIDAAYTLYRDPQAWDAAVQSIRQETLNELCDDWDRIERRIYNVIRSKINQVSRPLEQQQRQHQHLSQQIPNSVSPTDVIQEVLRHQTNRSTEYFSRYIEMKEKFNKSSSESFHDKSNSSNT